MALSFAQPYPGLPPQYQQGTALKAGGEKNLPLSWGLRKEPIAPQFEYPPGVKVFGETNPSEVLSIYELTIKATHGEENTKAKVIHLILDGIARS
jgi:hypothetical protein